MPATRNSGNARSLETLTAVPGTEYSVTWYGRSMCGRDPDRCFWWVECDSRYRVPATRYGCCRCRL